MDELIALARGKRVVALTGAGCSTESGIPDYRGPDTPPPARPPVQHRDFVDRADARAHYWARAMLGWPRFSASRPNAAHHALAGLERTGALAGIITQNVDSLHHAAGSRTVVELHGALARVRCLACGAITARDALQARLVAANPTWLERHAGTVRPDGDVEVTPDPASFRVVACEACDGDLMPDVVFFGGSVPRATLDAAWALFERAELLLVAGSSLAVYSGYRFVRRAAERAIPIAIVNRGPTRGDTHAVVRIDARLGEALPALEAAVRR